MNDPIFLWRITVGGGYGEFLFVGLESEAEDRRAAKARWEGAVAKKTALNSVGHEYVRRYRAHGPFSPASNHTMAEMLSGSIRA